jgi:hypothetical protein
VSAYSLLLTSCNLGVDDINKKINKIELIHKQMKKTHFWLSGTNYYPLITLLSNSDKVSTTTCLEINKSYKKIKELGLFRTSGIYFISFMLSLSNSSSEDKLIYVSNVYELLKENKIKLNSNASYIALGFLCLLQDYSLKITQDVIDVYKQFQKNPEFKNNAAISLLFSTTIVSSEYLSNSTKNFSNLALSSSLESIIAAQNSASVAAVASSTYFGTITG